MLTSFFLGVICASQHVHDAFTSKIYSRLRCIHVLNLTNPTSLLDRPPYLNYRCLQLLPIRPPQFNHSRRHQISSPTVKMINQLNRKNGLPTPYFFRGFLGINPYGLNPHSSVHLTVNYHYLCSLQCRGVQMAPVRHFSALSPSLKLPKQPLLLGMSSTDKDADSRLVV